MSLFHFYFPRTEPKKLKAQTIYFIASSHMERCRIIKAAISKGIFGSSEIFAITINKIKLTIIPIYEIYDGILFNIFEDLNVVIICKNNKKHNSIKVFF